MIEARAVVVRAGEGKAWAQLLESQGGCGRCDEPGGCHAPRFAEMFKGGKPPVFAVDDPFGLRAGERVRIVIDDGVPLRAALASYGLGTALVLAGAALGTFLAAPAWVDAAVGAGAVGGAAITAFVLRCRARRRDAASWLLRLERDGDDGGLGACMRQGA
ncbi:MAG: SoxR reducing system RseC family protein [Azoarcus sp.]|jgi:sigma-E factor negative regulatory protein RseC|nr:SoxR reducing system RseC family protein [Azoarcus sp.]